MKKLILITSALLTLISCSTDSPTSEIEDENDFFSTSLTSRDTLSSNERSCASQDILDEELRKNPELAMNMDKIEEFTSMAILNDVVKNIDRKITIPVVVNVLYRTSAENISLSQIQSQINSLNQDFNGTNIEFDQVPRMFASVKANIGITFVLDKVNRKKTSRTEWSISNEEMKKTSFGGIAPTSPTNKLNLWVCTLAGGILGYAKAPGTAIDLDGVVIDSRYLGTNGRATAPFHKGRTATHEIGHWLNVKHIWGDNVCGNDLVDDTPSHNAPNYGMPVFPHYSTCPENSIEMTMNYMDYTHDVSMYMFTNGQKYRMLTQFLPGGYRYTFTQ